MCNHKEKDKMQQKLSKQMSKLTTSNFLFDIRRLLIFSRGEFLEQTSKELTEF